MFDSKTNSKVNLKISKCRRICKANRFIDPDISTNLGEIKKDKKTFGLMQQRAYNSHKLSRVNRQWL
ncbi:MAG: hypothetical protein CVT49_12220 [candidate division Zixibacteria bacterium HGW-Zixibacteria-1]|nr:MAG: hypothetical protein CVT49_12220 [candidate division Zixibacteria bacterium HGW-Zixibacteria-1]